MPKIIDDELFYKCQEIKSTKLKPRNNAKHSYFLTSKIYCGKCGSDYSGNGDIKTKAVILFIFIRVLTKNIKRLVTINLSMKRRLKMSY